MEYTEGQEIDLQTLLNHARTVDDNVAIKHAEKLKLAAMAEHGLVVRSTDVGTLNTVDPDASLKAEVVELKAKVEERDTQIAHLNDQLTSLHGSIAAKDEQIARLQAAQTPAIPAVPEVPTVAKAKSAKLTPPVAAAETNPFA